MGEGGRLCAEPAKPQRLQEKKPRTRRLPPPAPGPRRERRPGRGPGGAPQGKGRSAPFLRARRAEGKGRREKEVTAGAGRGAGLRDAGSVPGPPRCRSPPSSRPRGFPSTASPSPRPARLRGRAALAWGPLTRPRAMLRSSPSALPSPAPRYCAPSISKVRRLLSRAALPAHSAPRRFLLRRLPLAAVALPTSFSSPRGLPVPPLRSRRTLTPFPMVAVLGARRRVLSLENQREKQRAAPGRASGAGGAEWRELGLPRGGREGGRPAARADAAAAVAAAAGAATAAAATCPPPPAAALRPRPRRSSSPRLLLTS